MLEEADHLLGDCHWSRSVSPFHNAVLERIHRECAAEARLGIDTTHLWKSRK